MTRRQVARRRARPQDGSVSRRERAPWRPEKGQYIRPWGTRLAVSERAAILLVFCAILLVIAFVIL